MRLLRGLGGRLLSCGCLTGVYESYEGRIVQIIDAVDDRCGNPLHRRGHRMVAADIPEPPAPPRRSGESRPTPKG